MENILDDMAESRFDADARFVFSENGVKQLARKDTFRFIGILLMSMTILLLGLKYYANYSLTSDTLLTSSMPTVALVIYAFFKYNRTLKSLRTFEVYVGEKGVLRKIKGLDDYFLPWSEVTQASIMKNGNIHIETGTKGKNILLWKHLDRFEILTQRLQQYTNVVNNNSVGSGALLSSGMSLVYLLSMVGVYILHDTWLVVILTSIVVIMTSYFTYNYLTNAQLSIRYKLSVIPLIIMAIIPVLKTLWLLGIIDNIPAFIP